MNEASPQDLYSFIHASSTLLTHAGLSAGSHSAGSHGESEGKKSAGAEEADLSIKLGPGGKPPLRVYIPGQKEFVPRTVRLAVI